MKTFHSQLCRRTSHSLGRIFRTSRKQNFSSLGTKHAAQQCTGLKAKDGYVFRLNFPQSYMNAKTIENFDNVYGVILVVLKFSYFKKIKKN